MFQCLLRQLRTLTFKGYEIHCGWLRQWISQKMKTKFLQTTEGNEAHQMHNRSALDFKVCKLFGNRLRFDGQSSQCEVHIVKSIVERLSPPKQMEAAAANNSFHSTFAKRRMTNSNELTFPKCICFFEDPRTFLITSQDVMLLAVVRDSYSEYLLRKTWERKRRMQTLKETLKKS